MDVSKGQMMDTVRAAGPAGVIGLGLMGTSITAALLAAGHSVTSLSIDPKQRENAPGHIVELLRELRRAGMLAEDAEQLIQRLHVTDDYKDFANCQIVIESIIEDLPAKRAAIRKTEEVVSADALIGSNTSSIPVTLLQQGALHPERILGIHWAEPAHVTRFMEIISGNESGIAYAERAVEFARGWGKEPTLVRKDIRGFITNRIMYAMIREAFFLVENGYATVADIDRSVRNDMGFWMTLAGPFRYMDLTGVPAYRSVMKDLLPELSCQRSIPTLMEEVVGSGGLGVANGRGFYEYTPEQARRWEEIFLKFTYEIRALAQKYPEGIGD
jgi:3-hydroxybutyryl-CoA dehydrogenase